MFRPKLFLWLLLSCFGFGGWSSELPPEARTRIDALIASHMAAHRTPGLALAVTGREQIWYIQNYGYSDLKREIPVTAETLFQIGSISKSFTGLLLMMAYDDGEFDLHAPISHYLPEVRIPSSRVPVTVHHLLSHTSGIPANADHLPSSPFQALAANGLWTDPAPGTRFHYSNVGYQILGFLASSLHGGPLDRVLIDRVFAPLGMCRANGLIDHASRQRTAVGYRYLYDDRPPSPNHPLVEATWIEYGSGDGGIAATATDMAAFARLILARGRIGDPPLLTERAFARWAEPHAEMAPGQFYGYGLVTRDLAGDPIFFHAGGMLGYSAYLAVDPVHGFGIVAMVNGPGYPGWVIDALIRLVRAAIRGEPLPDLAPVPPRHEIGNGSEYAGHFQSHANRAVRVVTEGKRLFLEEGGARYPLFRFARDRFTIDHPRYQLYLVEFKRDKQNQVSRLEMGPDWFYNDRYRGPAEFQVPPNWRAYTGHYRTQNPWNSNFRVVIRMGKLWYVSTHGTEGPPTSELVELKPGLFRIGRHPNPERLKFDDPIQGKTQRTTLSGTPFYRAITP